MNACKIAIFLLEHRLRTICKVFASLALAACCISPAHADDAFDGSLHAQATVVDQYHPAFRSPYEGPNSLSPKSVGDETFDATLFLGLRKRIAADTADGKDVKAVSELATLSERETATDVEIGPGALLRGLSFCRFDTPGARQGWAGPQALAMFRPA